MSEFTKTVTDTPWKLFSEIGMYTIKPFVYLYLWICGVGIGRGAKFYGFPRIYKHRGSSITIGNNFECRNWKFSNPLGINHSTIICTWKKGSKILLGDDVGISGGSIVASSKITIGDRVLIGANTTIIDNNFHPLRGENKRYSKMGIAEEPVSISNDVFIGMNAIVLKGAKIKKGIIVPAGAVVRN